jgi:serine protease Do
MIKLATTAAVGFVLCWACEFTHAQQLRDSFRRVKSSVVIVHSAEAKRTSSAKSGDIEDSGLGSGVLISNDGKILTAAHVIEGEGRLLIEFANEEWIPARVLSSSSSTDVALLQCDRLPKAAVAAKLGDSDMVETGDDIFIVGAPYGLSYTLTVGRVSARRPDQSRSGILGSVEFLQTDAAVNAGNSGSPVFNKEEEVVGIVTSILTDSGDFQGVGFAATVNAARAQLLDGNGEGKGIEGVLVFGPLAKALNLPQPAGFLVTSVTKSSVAERLGLKGGELGALIDTQELLLGGDVILEVDGAVVDNSRQSYRNVITKIGLAKSRAAVTVKILRNGKVMLLETK